MNKRIPYYKNIKKDSKKQLGGGGPRDLQRRQDPLHKDITALRELLEEKKSEEKVVVKDESQSLPFEEVRKKIQEAVEFTRKDEAERYESSLKNLNDQLNAAKKKMSVQEDQLINKNAEVKKLKSQIINSSQNGKSQVEINDLKKRLEDRKAELEKKDEVIVNLSETYNKNIDEFKHKLDNIDKRISHGTISSEDPERPQINDKVFIDPLEGETKLDSHITVEAEKISASKSNRNVMNDIKKLKYLLKAKRGDN